MAVAFAAAAFNVTAQPGTLLGGVKSEKAEDLSLASVEFSVNEGADDLVPTSKVAVRTDGKLQSVELVSADGKHNVPGELGQDGQWISKGPLQLDTTYKATATAASATGRITVKSRTFSTVTPTTDATYTVTPDGTTVGVGMPVMVNFHSAVETPEQRAAVEKRMQVTTVPAQKGSWGWVDKSSLMWRPDTYWKPNTKVTVKAPLAGVQTGSGKWVRENKGAVFTTAKRARVIRVDLDDHFMRVVDNGKVTATYPISAGQAKGTWETRSGTKVITEMHRQYTMDAGTLGVPKGDPNYYKTEVDFAIRVTNTGEFFHSAPWSVGHQGRRNVSHGCVNMSPRDAREFYRSTMIGDPAEFVDSKRQMQPGDGLPVWLYSTQEWRKRSALT